MIIGITINNTIRDHITKLQSVYTTLTNNTPVLPINPYNLEAHFPTLQSLHTLTPFDESLVIDEDNPALDFEAIDDGDDEFDVHDFIYIDASFEIFGSSEETVPGIIKKISALSKESSNTLVLTNLESPRSKLATLYFLSKCYFDMKEVYFPESREDMWLKFDVLVTDDPKLISIRPAGKKVVKINTPFNQHLTSDLSYDNINLAITNFEKDLQTI